NGAGIPFEDENAPHLDAVKGKVHLAAIAEPVLMTVLRLVGMGLWGRLAPALRHMGDVIVHEFVQRHNTTDCPGRDVGLGQQTPVPKLARVGMGFLEMIHLHHPWEPDFARRLLGAAFFVYETGKVLRLKPGNPRIHGWPGHVTKATDDEIVLALIVEFYDVKSR